MGKGRDRRKKNKRRQKMQKKGASFTEMRKRFPNMPIGTAETLVKKGVVAMAQANQLGKRGVMDKLARAGHLKPHVIQMDEAERKLGYRATAEEMKASNEAIERADKVLRIVPEAPKTTPLAVKGGIRVPQPIEKLDLYRVRAAEMFGVRYEDVTKEQRAAGKKALFLELHGARDSKFVVFTTNQIDKIAPDLIGKGGTMTGRTYLPHPSIKEVEPWIDKHSVNCFLCGKLVDERECVPGEDFEGDICPECQTKGGR